MNIGTKLVDNVTFHIWTDALHARELARKARDRWNRGTYVRWAVRDAWTAFEAACEDALGVSDLGIRFRERLDDAIDKKSLAALDWGRGLWQQVLQVYGRRKDYAHPRVPQARLFTPPSEAEDAIRILRDAIKAIYRHASLSEPVWVDADVDFGGERASVAHATVTHAGVDENTPGAIRTAYVYRGKERVSDILPAGTEWRPLVDQLIEGIVVPISKVLVYEVPNHEPIFSRDIPMRGSD